MSVVVLVLSLVVILCFTSVSYVSGRVCLIAGGEFMLHECALREWSC